MLTNADRTRLLTLDEEQVSSSILFAVREVFNDAIHVVRRWHEQIHGLEFGLRLSVAGDRLDHYLEHPVVNKSALQ